MSFNEYVVPIMAGFAFIVFLGRIVEYYNRIKDFGSNLTRVVALMDDHVKRDEARMQLLNDALLKLAQESAAANAAAAEIKRVVTSATNDPQDQYARDVQDLIDQGYDHTEAARIATQRYNEQLLSGM